MVHLCARYAWYNYDTGRNRVKENFTTMQSVWLHMQYPSQYSEQLLDFICHTE